MEISLSLNPTNVSLKIPGILPFLDTVIASVCCDLDATIAASFTSGQTWANLIAAPADSAAQVDYDFFLGADGSASTDDPTFTGSAGDAAAFFELDGGDFFDLKSITNAIAIKNAHRSDVSGFWICIALKHPSSSGTINYLGNSDGAGTAGFRMIDLSADDDMDLFVSNGSSNVIKNNMSNFLLSENNLILLSWDGVPTTNNLRIWSNSTIKNELSMNLGTNTSPATSIMTVGGANSSAANPVLNGTRIYHFSCGNAFLDDVDAVVIFTHLEARHDRDYTPPWDLRQVAFNNTFDTSAQNTTSAGMFLRADGVKMFVIDFGTNKVFQYTLSTPGDVSTATFDTGKEFSVASEGTSPQGVWFKNDGTKMYISDTGAGGNIFQYSLSTAWDVSTASYDSKSLDTSTQSAPRDLFIKPDGTELYIAGPTGSSVYQYTLSTPHDVSTGSFTGSFDVTTQENSIVDVYFKDDDGTKMFIVGLTGDTIFQYTLSTPWDVTSASFDNISFSVATKSTTPQGLVFDSLGETFYIVDSTNDIYAFDVGKI